MDKRARERAKRRIKVRYGPETADRTAFTKNISETGLNLKTNQVFKPGSTLLVEISFPQQQHTMWGRVVWAKKVPPRLAHVLECGMGIAFVEPTPEWRAFYRRWRDGQ